MANMFTKSIEAAPVAPAAPAPSVTLPKPPSIVVPGKVVSAPAMAPVTGERHVAGAITEQKYQYATQPDLMGKDDVEQFQANLQLLREGFPHKELVAPVLRRILTDLDNHPEWKQWLAPEDSGAMIRTLKQSYGIMVQIAQAKKKKKKDAPDLGGIGLDDLKNMMVGMS